MCLYTFDTCKDIKFQFTGIDSINHVINWSYIEKHTDIYINRYEIGMPQHTIDSIDLSILPNKTAFSLWYWLLDTVAQLTATPN